MVFVCRRSGGRQKRIKTCVGILLTIRKISKTTWALYLISVSRAQIFWFRRLLHLSDFSLYCVVPGKHHIWNIPIISQSDASFVVFHSIWSRTIYSDSIRHKSKKKKNPISWALEYTSQYVPCFGVKSFRVFSLAAVQLFLSLKQLIHSSITKAEGLIEMFSHFSLARRRIVNHSSVVYFEISFGVWASAALFFTQTSQSGRLVCFLFS